MNRAALTKPGCILGVLLGGILGGMGSGFLFVTGINFTWDLKSTDFLTAVLAALGVLLAAVSVLIALVALVAAIAAIYGWNDFKRRTGETAEQKAAAVARPAAVEAAVPAAIAQVDRYLENLGPEIRQKVVAIVGQIVTPTYLAGMVERGNTEQADRGEDAVTEERVFPEGAVEAAATDEARRQEGALDAFDATVEADRIRGNEAQPQEDDV